MTSTSDVLATIDLHTDDRARALLDEVIARCAKQPATALAVFDLDSTLLDNHTRQVKIMREFGDAQDVDALRAIEVEHWEGWDYLKAMTNAGLERGQAEALAPAYRDFWHGRFFSSEYCWVDEPMAGASEFAARVTASGARLLYVTGRHEPMRSGTVRSFERGNLPLPDGDRVQLIMKPTLDEDDDAYKERTHERLRSIGDVVAAFDNEPAHINAYRDSFADAVVVHLATDHSLRPIRVRADIPSIRDFTGR